MGEVRGILLQAVLVLDTWVRAAERVRLMDVDRAFAERVLTTERLARRIRDLLDAWDEGR